MMGSSDQLEDSLREPYTLWKKNPGPKTNGPMLQALQPTIEGAIRTHVGDSNPLLLSRARLMALDGLHSYDPKRGKLQTHLYNHLQGLKRVNRQQTTIIKVPEKLSLDRYNLENHTQELAHTLGREPTDEELADHSGFSVKRIAKARSYNPAVAEGTIDDATMGGGPSGGMTQPGSNAQDMITDLVYDEMDNYHRAVMEHSLGLNGRRVLSNMEVAKRLKRSPGAISQAKLRIQRKLDEASGLRGIM